MNLCYYIGKDNLYFLSLGWGNARLFKLLILPKRIGVSLKCTYKLAKSLFEDKTFNQIDYFLGEGT
ncbi:MAG TPA: hypothetical protein DC053_00500 [Lachnoclostridium sp.]|nr:hypothetical protein [Lachnoclostridium sp.]